MFLLMLKKLQVAINASRVHPKDPEVPVSGVDDMTKLAYLHEPGVLDNLKRRYDINEIYVSSMQFPYLKSTFSCTCVIGC